MGKKNGNENKVAEYKAKSSAEIAEDREGKSTREKMRTARMHDVEAAESKERRFYVCSMVSLEFAGLAFVAVGICTAGWYTAQAEPEQATATGDYLKRKQDWAIWFNGIGVFIEWCSDLDGTCIPGLDQFRYFDNEANEHSVQWIPSYLSVVDEAAASSLHLLLGTIWIILTEGTTLGIGIAAYMKPLPRNYALLSFWLHVLSCILIFVLVFDFTKGTRNFRDLVKTESYIKETEPNLEPGFSMFLYIAAGGAFSLAILPFYKLVPGYDPMSGIIIHKIKVREDRRQQYKTDIQNTSYVLEAVPEDSFDGTRRPGWTGEVVGAACNPLQGREPSMADVADTLPGSPMATPAATPAPSRPTSAHPSRVSNASRPTSANPSSIVTPEFQFNEEGELINPTVPDTPLTDGAAGPGRRPVTASPARPETPGSPLRPGSPVRPSTTSPARPGTAGLERADRVAAPGSPFYNKQQDNPDRPTTASPGRSIIERASRGRISLNPEQLQRKELKTLAKGNRPLSALPPDVLEAQYGLAEQVPVEYRSRTRPVLPPLEGDKPKERVLLDRTLPCPETWAKQKTDFLRPALGRAGSPVNPRVRPVTKVPLSGEGKGQTNKRADLTKAGTIENPCPGLPPNMSNR